MTAKVILARSKKIVIVEDDPSLSKILSDKLIGYGFDVTVATDGDSGLLSVLRHKPDLLILDIMLPKLDGLEVLKTLRKKKWAKQLPVIVLTNVDNIETLSTSMLHGVKFHYIKSNTSIAAVAQTARSVIKAS